MDNPQPPNQSVVELRAIRQELAALRKDTAALNEEMSSLHQSVKNKKTLAISDQVAKGAVIAGLFWIVTIMVLQISRSTQ
ncbi:hypothetical protein HY772_09195 [Candidatus Woesearchaeota archaeon]|nr:hypothetical protein [Candidatus Woesearchaeota archaeon]